MWEMKKVKQSRKGSKTYSNWMASWREGNKTRRSPITTRLWEACVGVRRGLGGRPSHGCRVSEHGLHSSLVDTALGTMRSRGKS